MKYADYTQAVNGTNNTSVMTPLRVKQAIQANGSGEGGTSDYNDLENKPKINGVTLEGDKSSSDLGISVPSVDNETIIDSPNLTAIGVKESSGNVDRFLTLTLSEYNAIENKDPNTFYNITDDTDKVDKGVVLYEGGTGGDVPLSDAPSNYTTLDIYYNVGSSTLVQTVKANSAFFVLTLSEIDNQVSGNIGIINHYKQYIVNGSTLTAAAVGRLFKYQVDTNVTQDTVNYLWILKVIGYK